MTHQRPDLWDPAFLTLHLASDAIIFIVSLAIPIALFRVMRRRKDLPFHWIFLCFGIFVAAAGFTYALEIWSMWHPGSWLSSNLKGPTATALVLTAGLLVVVVPQWLAQVIASPDTLERTNRALEKEIAERKAAEEVIRRLQRQHEQILNTITEGIHWIDGEGRIIFENPAAARMLGWEVADLIGRPAHLTIHHTRADGSPYREATCPIYAGLKDGVTRHVDNEVFCRKDGSFFPVEYTSTPVRDESGAVTGTVVVFKDISQRQSLETARREHAEELARERQRLDDMLNSVPAMVFEYYADNESTGREDFVSNYVEELFGFTKEEWAPKDFWRTRVYPEDLAFVMADYTHAFATGNFRSGVPFRWVTKDDRVVWAESHLLPIFNSDGKPLGLRGVTFDVTTRKLAEAELQESKRFLQSALNALSAHIGILDEEGRIIAVNEAWNHFAEANSLAGDSCGVGSNYLDVCESASGDCSSEASAVARGIRGVIAQEIPEFELEYPCHSPAEQRWFVVRVTRFRGSGPIRVVVAHEDITSRKQAEEELRWKTALLEAQVESYDVGILVVDNDGRQILQNQRMAELWKIPSEIAETKDDARLIEFVVGSTRSPARFVEKISHLYAHPDECSTDEIELLDGTIIERYSAPVKARDGSRYGRIWTFADITQRRREEIERLAMNQQLMEVSRQAGMAEVATSVLHNVGNVLNSVNISCSVITDKVRTSRMTGVAKAADLLRKNAGDLAAFFTSDHAGQQFPDYFDKLAIRLAEERASLLEEVRLLRDNIEHIKEIVAMQQDYGRVSGVIETMNVIDLVEDSLRMNAGALTRHEVELVRDYGETPPITVEKHKVLQILINLIRNAKYACDETGKLDKRMTVRVSSSPENVRVAVIDNGIGIPPENLTRIFSHGFTTKKNGHGFGLHNAVLTAQAMGGDLTAQSEGHGAGAIFTLTLPLTCQGGK